MSDVLIWASIVAVILAYQGTERWDASDAAKGVPVSPRMQSSSIARILVVAAAGLVFVGGLLSIAGAQAPGSAGSDRNAALVGGALQAGAGLISLGLFYYGTERVPGLRRLRPRAPVSWLAILLFLESIASNLTPSSGQASVSSTVQSTTGSNGGGGTTAESLMLGAVPFLVLGIAAAGPWVRRNARQTAERLGLLPLRLPWWVVGLAVGVLLVPVGDQVAGWLSHLDSTQCLVQQQEVHQALTGTGRTVLEQIGVAIAAALGEETLFRGALQPRFGILLSSALWASFHLQYTCNGLPGSSNLYILLLGLVFGVLRKRGGLWPAILAHAAYDGVILLNLL